MRCCFKIQMVQVGVATWCWLLAFGIGSGLQELNLANKTKQTTGDGYEPPTKHTSNITGFQNNAPPFETMTTSAPLHKTTSTTISPLSHNFNLSSRSGESNGKSDNFNVSVRSSGKFNNFNLSGGSRESSGKFNNSSQVNAWSRKESLEKVFVPVQRSEQETFIRVKHGPLKGARTSKFVVKVADTTERRKKHTDIYKNHTTFNHTADVLATKYSNSHRNARFNRSRNQYSRKKIVSIGIPASSHLVSTTGTTTRKASTTPEPAPPDSDEYYSSYVDYPDFAANAYNNSGYKEDGILPDPDLNAEDEVAEPEPDALIPDDSLADTDLHDHDLIDSVMYIYFGASDRDEGGVGKQVLIVGAVIALVAQFLTVACVFRRLRTHPEDCSSLVILNAEIASAISNLTFMLGIQATGDRSHCQMVAVTLHYLHLVTCSWYFVNCINAYRHVHNPEHRTKIRLYCIMAWISPALVVMICFLLNQKGYEIRSYCWMSLEKGMLFSFMIPVSILILLNTLFAVMGLREVSLLKTATDSDRKSLRVAATLLPMFAVVWFLGVVALENSASLVFPFLFVTTNGFMNWFIFACWLPPDLSVWKESDDEYEEDEDDIYEEIPGMLKNQHSINDVQPLLDDTVYVCGRRDMCELQMDPICTISS